MNPHAQRRLRRHLAGWALACTAALWLEAGITAPAAAQNAAPSTPLERRVKAAFLYKFLGYAEFPANAFADAGAPLTIGVVDADDVAVALARIVVGRTAGNRGITVHILRESEIGTPMHMLFVGGQDAGRVSRLLRQANTLLAVTECDKVLPQGSAINFRIIDDRVRFDVALDAAEKNGIKLSSRLLAVANRVQKGAQ
ncbi:MAG TPA: YfiR family protein [Telluria sp.]